MTKYSQADIEQAREQLSFLKPGDTLHTSLRHVAQNGMSRHISVHHVSGGNIRDITWAASRLLGFRISDKTGALVVGGCGMDMGFHVVYSLSRSLFKDGHKCTGTNGWAESPAEENGWKGKRSRSPRCPSNDHMNEGRDSVYKRSRVHSDGGYAISQSWI